MEKRRLGTSELYPTVVGFGAWAAGRSGWGEVSEDEVDAAIRRAVELGINFFDTAPSYGLGESEYVLGRALSNNRDKVIIATKCGLEWDDKGQLTPNLSRANVIREVEDSLRRLQTDYIDLYQVHRPDPSGQTSVEETFSALNELAEQGKIRYIGVSNFSVHELVAAQSVSNIVSLQSPYNLFQRDLEHTVLPYAKQQRVGFIPFIPLAQGLLTGKFKSGLRLPDTDVRSQLNPLFSRRQFEQNIVKVETLAGIAKSIGKPLNQVAINWLLYRNEVSTVIVGAKNVRQVEQNASAVKWRLTREDYAQISRLFEADSSYVI